MVAKHRVLESALPAYVAWTVLLCVLPAAHAQTSDLDAIASEGWEVWMRRPDSIRHCRAPCQAVVPAGEVEVRVATAGPSEPRHRFVLTLLDSAELHVGRRSREGERRAGAVTLALGWAAAVGMAIGLGAWAAEPCPAPSCLRFPGLDVLLVALPSVSMGALCSIIGGLLLGSTDEPYLEVESGSRRWRVAPALVLADGGAVVTVDGEW